MRGDWIVKSDGDRECYRILTADKCIEHDGTKERQWIADVYEYSDAKNIVSLHNAALDIKGKPRSSYNTTKGKIRPCINKECRANVWPQQYPLACTSYCDYGIRKCKNYRWV